MIPFLMKRSKAVLFIAAILLLFGTYSAVNLPVKVFPSLTFPYIQVTASVKPIATSPNWKGKWRFRSKMRWSDAAS